MALITCIDCGRQISDMAPACPCCGRPANVYGYTQTPAPMYQPQYQAMAMQTPYGTVAQTPVANTKEIENVGTAGQCLIAIFSLLFPIIGFILFLAWYNTKPILAKMAAKLALGAILIPIVVVGVLALAGM